VSFSAAGVKRSGLQRGRSSPSGFLAPQSPTYATFSKQSDVLPTRSSITNNVVFKPFAPPSFGRSSTPAQAAGDTAVTEPTSETRETNELSLKDGLGTEQTDSDASYGSDDEPAPIIFQDGMQGIEGADGKLYKVPVTNGKPGLSGEWIEMTQRESDWYVEQKPIIDADELDRQNGVRRREPNWKSARRYALRKPATMDKSGLSEGMFASITAVERAAKKERSEARKLAKRRSRYENSEYAPDLGAARETGDVLTRHSKRRRTEAEGHRRIEP